MLSDLANAFRLAGLDPGPAERIDNNDAGEEDETDEPESTTDEPFETAPPIRPIVRRSRPSHYYLGHVLLLPKEVPEQFWIYDGQQRLTTLTLLLCALRDAAGADGEWYPIQAVLRTDPPDNQPRLTVRTGGGALARIVGAFGGTKRIGGAAGEAADRRLYEAAGFLRGNATSWDKNRREAFAAFLLDNVYLTVTQMRDRNIAEYAYITINTRGRPLENKDIIKGHFVQLASRRSLTDANEMSQSWDRLERMAGKRLDDLLRIAFLLHYRQPATFDFGAQLMDHFEEESRLDEVTDWVSVRLREVVTQHKRLILDPQQHLVLGPPLSSLRRMTFLPWNQWQALAFHFAERDRNAPKRFATSVAALERWCFSLNLVDVSDDIITDNVIRALNEADPFGPGGALRLSKSWRDRARARLHDGQIMDDQRRGAHVRWLETRLWPDSAVNFAATNDASVEHVLPRRPSGQWLEDFPESMLIHTELLGNLCLVPKKVNDAVGREQYEQKRSAYLALPPQYKSAHDVAAAERWTMAAVQKRTERLEGLSMDALRLNEKAWGATGQARPKASGSHSRRDSAGDGVALRGDDER